MFYSVKETGKSRSEGRKVALEHLKTMEREMKEAEEELIRRKEEAEMEAERERNRSVIATPGHHLRICGHVEGPLCTCVSLAPGPINYAWSLGLGSWGWGIVPKSCLDMYMGQGSCTWCGPLMRVSRVVLFFCWLGVALHVALHIVALFDQVWRSSVHPMCYGG